MSITISLYRNAKLIAYEKLIPVNIYFTIVILYHNYIKQHTLLQQI